MIDLYCWKSANGRRPIIILEETGTPYNLIAVDPHSGKNKEPEYLKISPGGKVPCLIDPDGPGGEPIHLMESAAILEYIGGKTGQFIGETEEERWQVKQWLIYLATNVSVSFSNLNHARDLEGQCRTLLEAINHHLAENEYFAGNYSVADMMAIGRFAAFAFDFIDLNEYPNLVRWVDALTQRPAVQKSMEIPIG
ncbi:MAG: glutathione S-transferase [Rhodospirillaceae bacterium]|nr:glutathione S-transferase [Rhodospirillaceae bacterium]|tara:strand:+ start:23415 stop:23999 length:585 start_codon:yes stop_codon:yes gene_type:complete